MFVLVSAAALADPLNLAPFARPCCSEDRHRLQTMFDYGHAPGVQPHAGGGWVYGLQWAEERDVSEIRVTFSGAAGASRLTLQYWNQGWPYEPPLEHTIDDPLDDPWQGDWVSTKAEVTCEGQTCRLRFPPLEVAENRNARKLPGVSYRRTLKIRLLFTAGERPAVESVAVFSESQARRFDLRVRLKSGVPAFEAYNGYIRSVSRQSGSTLLSLDGADPRPAGSNDITVVKVRGPQGAFSFAPADLDRGPIYVPDFGAYITFATDTKPFSKDLVRVGARIRERIPAEPEQSYERASREIPPLDPVERSGGRFMLALAAEASWQKFGMEWGGNIIVSKRGTKAKGRELERLAWPGDTIAWRFGTGAAPNYRDAAGDSTLEQLEGYLPVGIARWSGDGLEYEEEAFATLLSGPLAPEDPDRSEQTPAVLLVRLRARNPGAAPREQHLWMTMRPDEPLAFENGLLSAGRYTRAYLRLPAGSRARVEPTALHVRAAVAPGSSLDTYISIPFIPELQPAERQRLAALDYAGERARVVRYWRDVTANAVPFTVPEERFNTFTRGLVARIRLSATKDPKSGLYMVPAASYRYQVYANEAAFQCQLLDVLGHPELAARYLQSHVALQGSKPLVGSFTGDQKDVYYGARVDADYDYTATPYNLHHGTVLWSLAEHYFMTRDRAWLASVAPSMKRAAGWVLEQRALTMRRPCPEYGLLPAGHLEDNRDWGHWFSVNAYASAGISALAEALRETGDPDAARYEREAAAYRRDLRAAVERAVEDAPVTRLRDNTYVPYVPTRALQRIRLFGPMRVGYYSRYGVKNLPTFRAAATRELLYGPLILLETGIFGAREPLAGWVLDDWEDNSTMSAPLGLVVHGWVDEEYWFSRGGMVFQPNLQNPVRTYLRRGEIPAALRSLYNNFVSCYYPSAQVFTEEYRQWAHPSGPFFKVPDEAKFVHRLRDLLLAEFDGDLHLAAGTPRRWLEPGREIRVTRAPTRYGPLTYSLKALDGRIECTAELPTRTPYREAWLHLRLPGGRRIGAVTIDGQPWKDLDAAAGRIRLPKDRRTLHIAVRTEEN